MNKKEHKIKKNSWADRLDAAVMNKFPDVECDTHYNLFAMNHVTTWKKRGTEKAKVPPATGRQVAAFVAGFMAAEEAWQ